MTGNARHKLFSNIHGPPVVATVHHQDDIDCILTGLPPLSADILEYRLDSLIPAGIDPLPIIAQSSLPAIITARHPAEGGDNSLDETVRLKLLQDHLSAAVAVDLEIQSKELIRKLASDIQDQDKTLIVSIHDFKETPASGTLLNNISEAVSLGANIVKIATFLNELDDLARLLDLLSNEQPIPLSVMGMGPYGPASRLLLAQHSSQLNYGYLSRENAPGQWPASLLKSALTQLGPIF